MPDKAGWRRKNKARPKELNLNVDTARPSVESGRPSSNWLRNSRPGTPLSATATDDARSEKSVETLTPRRATRPKISHYLSGIPHLKDDIDPDFADEWWNEIEPLPVEPPVDPQTAMQLVSKFMHQQPLQPIPVSMYSNIFRIFEDYRKVKEETGESSHRLHEALQAHEEAESAWVKTESQYQAEIKRLELLIARGTAGLTGLVHARQGSVVKKKRGNLHKFFKKSIAALSLELPPAQLDAEIRSRSKKVLLQRPVSPSRQMAVLSKQLTMSGYADDLHIGTPPSKRTDVSLSRRVKSELDLIKMSGAVSESAALENVGNTIHFDTASSSSSSSGDSEFEIAGDLLPDEMETEVGPSFSLLNSTIDKEAFVALQELGVLVANKQGLDPRVFINGLMQLLEPDQPQFNVIDDINPTYIDTMEHDMNKSSTQDSSISNSQLEDARSRPRLDSDERCRRGRHFSFEPGDDTTYPMTRMQPPRDGSQKPQLSNRSVLSAAVSDPRRVSKIPSPIHRPGLSNVRREGSLSSFHSGSNKINDDERRDSRSSVLTAFRDQSGDDQNLQLSSSDETLSVTGRTKEN
ncbi:unnamed protein product [Periconia digitata]|uniref:Uncharacterized protein n=1 Tax=Periconia digitata TaxID=1303443 RepID=A0A9W4UPC9_9PLEO|nr:unnamed protein product [Periconia digitata]